MSLRELKVEQLRCLPQALLQFDPGLNLITGPNGAGKTSLLEAIYLLGRGRSFRTRSTERLISQGEPRLRVVGRTYEGQPEHLIGFAFDREEGPTIRIDRQPARSLAELATLFPVQAIDPGIHRLVEEGPSYRRRWLDWGVFHVEHAFVDQWTAYSRGLKQRNAALAGGLDTGHWDRELARLGEFLSASRFATLEALREGWDQTCQRLLGRTLALSYHQGWNRERTLAEALSHALPKDRERGTTSVGPHRYDVVLTVDGAPAREVLSRGQQKLLGAAMAISLGRLVAARSATLPTLLVDDPAAELDPTHTARLLAEVESLGGQLIVTALVESPTLNLRAARRFHVEHGAVQPL
ncbi:MAG: DNA replication/repair protein RecF [Steroidobacteraceae bacterium]